MLGWPGLLLISFLALLLSSWLSCGASHLSWKYKVQNIWAVCGDLGFCCLFLHDSLAIKHSRLIFWPLNCPHTLQFRGGFVAACLGCVLVSKCESCQTGLWVKDGVMKPLQWSSAMRIFVWWGARVMGHFMAKIAATLRGDYGGRMTSRYENGKAFCMNIISPVMYVRY